MLSDVQLYILEKYAEWREIQHSGHDTPGGWSAQEFMCWLLGVEPEELLTMVTSGVTTNYISNNKED